MKKQNLILASLAAALVAGNVATAVALCGLRDRVREYEKTHGVSILAPASESAAAATNAVVAVTNAAVRPQVAAAPAVSVTNAVAVATNPLPRLAVEKFEYDDGQVVTLRFSERPDMEVIRRYLTVEPLENGVLSFEYDADYDCARKKYVPTVTVTGDYAYRTNVTLRLLKGFPLYGKGANPSAEGSLAEDYVRVFRRADREPYVKFAADGRYLPPAGRRTIAVEAMNVTNVETAVRRVEPKNVVQLLAREERVYRRYRWNDEGADDAETAELSGEPRVEKFACRNEPNRAERLPVAMNADDGGPANGLYLVSIINADSPEENSRWWSRHRYNPRLFRVVCVSDLGLSVRRSGERLGVWVTSFLTGRPVADAWIEVYSSANVLVAEGRTAANGLCEPRRIAKGEPFVVVARSPEADDTSFIALRESMGVEEPYLDGGRREYLGKDAVTAFAWTERGIYRHGEKMLLHALVRNDVNAAPKPMPVTLKLRNPENDVFAEKTLVTDADGSVVYDGFSVPADQPSGRWTLEAATPGKEGRTLYSFEVKVEEFAPPQIRVKVAADESRHPSNFTFKVSAEHLFGGPARTLACEGAVVFEDAPFAPAEWKGYRFGNDDLGLKPCFRRLSQRVLDGNGECEYEAPIWADAGRPKAAVRLTGQGTVFEDGGRPATARKSFIGHYYPYYLGCDLREWTKLPQGGRPSVRLVCVDRAGKALTGVRALYAKIERIDSIYTCRKNDEGWTTWDCERVRATVSDGVRLETDAGGRAVYELPLEKCGDYALTVEDRETGVSFGRTFYLSSWGDDVVRAPLSNPTEVTVRPDRAFYRVGEVPRLTIRSPFAGYAMISVERDRSVYTEVLELTNATSEVTMKPVERDWAPNVDVYVSVVQSVAANAKHLAVRAHGQTTVCVRPVENEVDVSLEAKVEVGGGGRGGSRVVVEVEAPGADFAVVTLVDEGINLLTGEKTPDPVAAFAEPRCAAHPLFDLYHRMLPVMDEGLVKNGVKTGGGFGAEMLGRVSPVPTRRFRPLALWRPSVALADGKGRAEFTLPEFVGEVRVTALAYSAKATGAKSVQRKVTPKLVMQPDAPRFAAPGDVFGITLPLHNRSGAAGAVEYELNGARGRVELADGASTNLTATVKAPAVPGQLPIVFRASGFGETHSETVELPVRPAVAWRDECGVARPADEERLRASCTGALESVSFRLCKSPVDQLVGALEWLADYPHGCLEQTSSRIFPLIAAGGILNAVGSKVATNREEYVDAGVRRVESMIRENDFTMWPDCEYAPWDREVSLYAAHFLVEAKRSGRKLAAATPARLKKFLGRWAMSTNDCVSAYACQVLALAGAPDKDRMFRLYDARDRLGSLSRARLARAFALVNDRKRAEALMADSIEPQSVKEAAFRVLALVELDPGDARLPALVKYLLDHRGSERFSWGTTGDNAHALLAIGEYYRHRAETLKEPFLVWRKRTLPAAETVRDDSRGIFIERRFLTADGAPARMDDLVRGELLFAELTVTSDVSRVVNDLVIEDLLPAAFEPVQSQPSTFNLQPSTSLDWILRKDARDDRVLVFSKKFKLAKGDEAKVSYPVRVVTAGDFTLPGPTVEGMYDPRLHSRRAAGRVVVRR